jgi:colanic acid biosynthesis glycosyl transferase WcaI
MSRRILVLSQVYVPDPAAGGQLIADACKELARRGEDVQVLTIARGYDDPSVRYEAEETRDGVRIERLPMSSFGKRSPLVRLLSGVAFTIQCAIRGLFTGPLDVVVVSSHPPMAPLAAIFIAWIKRAELIYWVMDLNPDQAVALGQFAPGSLPVRALDAMQRAAVRRADTVIALDGFMAERIRAKGVPAKRLEVIPPWPLRSRPSDTPRSSNPFRRKHGFGDRIVVMYSGNHSPSHPLTTLLTVANDLRNDERVVFAFVGGGVGKKDVDAIAGGSIVSLPYEPLETLHQSLAAGDVQVVTMGDHVVGINHPCKIYDALSAARPILFVGPKQSHVGQILAAYPIGWHVSHGDTSGLRSVLEQIAAMAPSELEAMGRLAGRVAQTLFSSQVLRDRLCALVAPTVAQPATRDELASASAT